VTYIMICLNFFLVGVSVLVDFVGYLCSGYVVDILFIEMRYGRVILYLNQYDRSIVEPSPEDYEVLKSINVSDCERITKEKAEGLAMSLIKVHYAEPEPWKHYTIYRLKVGRHKAYILEYYDESNLTYKYEVYKDFEDALCRVYD